MVQNDKEDIDEQLFIVLKLYIYMSAVVQQKAFCYTPCMNCHTSCRLDPHVKMDIFVQKSRGLYETLTVVFSLWPS